MWGGWGGAFGQVKITGTSQVPQLLCVCGGAGQGPHFTPGPSPAAKLSELQPYHAILPLLRDPQQCPSSWSQTEGISPCGVLFDAQWNEKSFQPKWSNALSTFSHWFTQLASKCIKGKEGDSPWGWHCPANPGALADVSIRQSQQSWLRKKPRSFLSSCTA